MKERNKDRKSAIFRNLIAVLKLLFLIGIIVGVPLLIYLRNPEILKNFKDSETINALIARHKGIMLLIFFALQVFQVVIPVVPGQAIQIAAGYSCNFWLAYASAIFGLGFGSVLGYFLAKLLGRDALRLIFGEERIEKFVDTLNSKKAYVALFVIFLIPGVPKDLFTYAAGLSEMKLRAFIPISLTARTPALMASILFGGMMRTGSIAGMIIMAAVVLIVFILGLKFRKKLTDYAEHLYQKVL
jgi:uncharacterized membrane protein YdjX (TVP38/TMEM64 family)